MREQARRGRVLLRGRRATLRRSRAPRIVGLVVVGGLVGWFVDSAMAEAQRRKADWEPTEPVWVVTRELGVGAPIGPDDARPISIPSVLRPRDATASPPWGRHLRHPMTPGEVVREGRLADGTGPGATALGDGRVGLPIDGTAPFAPADLVALHDRVTGARLTDAPAEVVSRDDSSMIVSVAGPEAPAVIRALGGAGVVAVLVG